MVDRRIKDGLRAGVAAFGVATGLMVLASTSQTPDGFIHASFGGPMDVFSNTASSDVLAIGDGSGDASEIAALLKGPANPEAQIPESPYTQAFQAGATPSPSAPSPRPMPLVDPTAAPAIKDAAILPVKPVVDSQGRVDCTGAVSCKTDPVTNITTVTFPDGVVAIVQKINDLTVVAYKTLTDYLPADVKALLPAPPTSPTPSILAAQAPASTAPSAPAPTSAPASPAPETSTPSFDPGPQAPNNDLINPTPRSGPKVNVSRPPMDFSPDNSSSGGPSQVFKPDMPSLNRIKDTLGSAIDAVGGAVGRVLNPGAAGKAGTGTAGPATGADAETP